MSLESDHAAAGAAATTARGEMKKEWYKQPTALHFVIGAGIIIIALIINFSFTFNLPWKLLMGGALVWGGGQLKAQKVNLLKVWGNILRGLGWVIIIIALLNSGALAVAEKAVITIDQGLNELAKDGTVNFSGSSPAANDVPIELDLRRFRVGDISEEQRMGLMTTVVISLAQTIKGQHNGVYWACPTTVSPSKLPFQPKFKVAARYTTKVHFVLTDDSKQELLANGTTVIGVKFTLALSPGNPCANFLYIPKKENWRPQQWPAKFYFPGHYYFIY